MDADILKNRAEGHRDTTYAMLLALQVPDCLRVLHQMVTTPHVGCWRDVRGVILQLEQGQGQAWDERRAAALISGCVRMTNAQIRLDCSRGAHSWAAKWVPREPKCRKSPLLQWYYDALAADMFPGAPDAKRRYRQLVARMSPPALGPTQLVRRALTETSASATAAINAAFMQHKRKLRPSMRGVIPALSLAHSMGPGHNNCLHAGIALALLVLSYNNNNIMITFSSHAQLHHVTDPHDFVSNVRYLAEAARAPVNGLNANLDAALNLARNDEALLVISDMEHDGNGNNGNGNNGNGNNGNGNNGNGNNGNTLFWNVAASPDYRWQRMEMPASSANVDTSGSLL